MTSSMKTPLGRVKGLGSAKDGTSTWWMQRTTAVALIPLGVWLVISVILVTKDGYPAIMGYLQHPFYNFLLISWIAISAFHGQLGLHVIVEDYVHHRGSRMACLLAIKGLAFGLAGWCIFCLLILQFKTF